jgi:hypothetical protein
MSGVFQNIDSPHPLTARREFTPLHLVRAGGGHTRWVERGWGVNILEDARHCSVLYIHKYFVGSAVYTILMRYELQQNFPPSGGKNWFINIWFLSLSTPLNVLIFQQWSWLIFGSEKGKMETKIVSLLSEQGTFSHISHGSESQNMS